MDPRGAPIAVWQRYVAANVQRLRIKRGLSQEGLADIVGVAPRYLQDVERGRTNLSLQILVRLAAGLDVDPRRLLRPATMPPARSGRPPRRQSPK